MINDMEKNFIFQFVVKNKQDRLLYELSGKKRMDGIGRFAHNAEEMLIKDKIILSGNNIYYNDIIKFTEKYNSNVKWYIIAFNREFDKKYCELSEALDLILGNGMPAIIVSGNTAIVETEQCIGNPMRYILQTK